MEINIHNILNNMTSFEKKEAFSQYGDVDDVIEYIKNCKLTNNNPKYIINNCRIYSLDYEASLLILNEHNKIIAFLDENEGAYSIMFSDVIILFGEYSISMYCTRTKQQQKYYIES